MQLLDHKKEILAAVFAALLTAVFSLSIGLYSLNRSFELTLKKDLLYGLNTDITLLKNVERELDKNLNLLLNQSYLVEINTEEAKLPLFPAFLTPGATKEELEEGKKMHEFFSEYLLQVRGRLFKVTKINKPSDKFITDAWQPSGPTVSSIDFELIQTLKDLYRKMNRVNRFIDATGEISNGMTLSESNINTMKVSVPRYNKMIDEISQNTILNLKNIITRELNRLQKERSQIIF